MGSRQRRAAAKSMGKGRVAAGVGLLVAAEAVVLRLRSGRLAGEVVVRCADGHLFTTIWIPGASLKSLRLGPRRFQRCPVGRHWSLVTPVKASGLSAEERRDAAQQRDIRIP